MLEPEPAPSVPTKATPLSKLRPIQLEYLPPTPRHNNVAEAIRGYEDQLQKLKDLQAMMENSEQLDQAAAFRIMQVRCLDK